MDLSKCGFGYVLFLLLCFFRIFSQAAPMDTISPRQLLRTSETILSASHKFELLFFRPVGNSTAHYLGIQYNMKNVSKGFRPSINVVWVANRDYLALNSSAVLSIGTDGNLLISQGRLSFKVSNVESNGNTSAMLLDSRNLILRDDKSNILWQSFDFPSHILLPGMKIGYDKRNRKTWSLISWRSYEDPSPGVFSLQLDPNGTNQLFIMLDDPNNGSKTLYWTSGSWDGKKFQSFPYLESIGMYNITYVLDTKCDVYACCGAFGSCSTSKDEQVPSSLQSAICKCLPGFEPRNSENWNASDYTAGCARKTSLRCENNSHAIGDGDGFLMLSGVKLPSNQIPTGFNATGYGSGAEDCKLACLSNCSCTAYSFTDYDGCSYQSQTIFVL